MGISLISHSVTTKQHTFGTNVGCKHFHTFCWKSCVTSCNTGDRTKNHVAFLAIDMPYLCAYVAPWKNVYQLRYLAKTSICELLSAIFTYSLNCQGIQCKVTGPSHCVLGTSAGTHRATSRCHV